MLDTPDGGELIDVHIDGTFGSIGAEGELCEAVDVASCKNVKVEVTNNNPGTDKGYQIRCD